MTVWLSQFISSSPALIWPSRWNPHPRNRLTGRAGWSGWARVPIQGRRGLRMKVEPASIECSAIDQARIDRRSALHVIGKSHESGNQHHKRRAVRSILLARVQRSIIQAYVCRTPFKGLASHGPRDGDKVCRKTEMERIASSRPTEAPSTTRVEYQARRHPPRVQTASGDFQQDRGSATDAGRLELDPRTTYRQGCGVRLSQLCTPCRVCPQAKIK